MGTRTIAPASNDNFPEPSGNEKAAPCPICGKAKEHHYRPFCSKRCADIDLGRWMTGAYFIAADPGGEEEDSLPPGILDPE